MIGWRRFVSEVTSKLDGITHDDRVVARRGTINILNIHVMGTAFCAQGRCYLDEDGESRLDRLH